MDTFGYAPSTRTEKTVRRTHHKLSDRVQEILSEKELEDLQDSLTDTDNEKKEDPILDEAVHILADMVELSAEETIITKTEQ